MRLVPDQSSAKIADLFRRYVEDICPEHSTVSVNVLHGAEPVLLPTDSPFMTAATDALSEIFGKDTIFMRSGGSIPIVSLFSNVLGVPSVLMGFGLPDDNLHAPNEKMKLDNVFKGIDASARYMELLKRSA
jgi:acetylornithine deacetylase/succinyl-diaminopimelate desuccinylase-like protein